MMKNDTHAQEQAERALSALEHIRRTAPAPFFFTRVKSRTLQKSGARHRGSVRVFAGIVAIAALVVLNIVTVVRLTDTNDPSTLARDNLESFADEYSLSYTLY